MEKSFPVILSELRKEKGISQKDAAAKLGISQALLSHYEKGIRECGQSFLVKAADFYGVTCDYLLGRSPSMQGVDDFDGLLSAAENSDTVPLRKTLIKALSIISRELMKNGVSNGIHLNEFITAQLYKIILIEAKAGILPPNWAGGAYVDGEVRTDELYLRMIDLVASAAVSPAAAREPRKEEEIPEALKTVLKSAENAVMSDILGRMPSVPEDK